MLHFLERHALGGSSLFSCRSVPTISSHQAWIYKGGHVNLFVWAGTHRFFCVAFSTL